jgi:mannosyltransferase
MAAPLPVTELGGNEPGVLRPRETAPSADGRSQLVLFAGVLFAALLLRLVLLGQTSLWLDEIWSIATARLPWRSVLWVVLHQDSNASLYYALLHLWMRLGSDVATVRLLSVLLGVMAIPALYVLGNRLYGRPAGLIAASLLAVNKLHISQSQEARGYSLVVLLVTLSSLFFVRSVERPVAKNWWGYVLFSALAIYAHLFAVLVLVAHWASLVFLRRREIPWKRLLASTAAIAFLTWPVGLLMWAGMRTPGAPPAWAGKLSLGSVGRLFWSLAGSGHFGLGSALVIGILLALAYFAVCLIAVVCAIQTVRAAGRSLPTWRLALPLCWFGVPIVLCVAVSFVTPVLVDKYLIICLPALALMAATGIQAIPSRRPAATAFLMLAGLAVLALVPYYQFRSRNDEWQAVTRSIISQARPGDAIIFFVAPGRLLFDYYKGEYRGVANLPDVLYPQFGDERRDPSVLAYLPPLDDAVLERAASRYQRVWLVLYHDEFPLTDPVSQRIQASLSAHYQKIQESRFEGAFERVALLLYAPDHSYRQVKPAPPPPHDLSPGHELSSGAEVANSRMPLP